MTMTMMGLMMIAMRMPWHQAVEQVEQSTPRCINELCLYNS